jgi:hypothetical protein
MRTVRTHCKLLPTSGRILRQLGGKTESDLRADVDAATAKAVLSELCRIQNARYPQLCLARVGQMLNSKRASQFAVVLKQHNAAVIAHAGHQSDRQLSAVSIKKRAMIESTLSRPLLRRLWTLSGSFNGGRQLHIQAALRARGGRMHNALERILQPLRVALSIAARHAGTASADAGVWVNIRGVSHIGDEPHLR